MQLLHDQPDLTPMPKQAQVPEQALLQHYYAYSR